MGGGPILVEELYSLRVYIGIPHLGELPSINSNIQVSNKCEPRESPKGSPLVGWGLGLLRMPPAVPWYLWKWFRGDIGGSIGMEKNMEATIKDFGFGVVPKIRGPLLVTDSIAAPHI